MSWQDYFVYDDVNECYTYKDKDVVSLPTNLPMPLMKNFRRLFAKCSKLQDITALSNWDVSEVFNMDSMFYCCHQLKDITALSTWNVSNVTNMSSMFNCCWNIQDITALSKWNVSNVINMFGMFSECYQLKDISALANWHISDSTNTRDIFYGCYREANILPVLGQSDNSKPIIGESALVFRWEINKLKEHIAYLEENMVELTKMISGFTKQ